MFTGDAGPEAQGVNVTRVVITINDRVRTVADIVDIGIVADSAFKLVTAGAADQGVIARIACQLVIAGAAVQCIVQHAAV